MTAKEAVHHRDTEVAEEKQLDKLPMRLTRRVRSPIRQTHPFLSVFSVSLWFNRRI
jgi:hypothetical protein